MSALPPERLTARHLNPDFVPRSRYEALAAERDLYHATSLALGVERDALVAENQQLRDALEMADEHLATALGGGIGFPTVKFHVKWARDLLGAALAGTPSEDTE